MGMKTMPTSKNDEITCKRNENITLEIYLINQVIKSTKKVKKITHLGVRIGLQAGNSC